MSIYVNNGDGERELREIETPRGVVTSVSVNHGDGNGEQTVWSSPSLFDNPTWVHDYDAASTLDDSQHAYDRIHDTREEDNYAALETEWDGTTHNKVQNQYTNGGNNAGESKSSNTTIELWHDHRAGYLPQELYFEVDINLTHYHISENDTDRWIWLMNRRGDNNYSSNTGNGFSNAIGCCGPNRVSWDVPDEDYAFFTYRYDSSNTGSTGNFKTASTGGYIPGDRWFTLRGYLKCNDPGEENAVYKFWREEDLIMTHAKFATSSTKDDWVSEHGMLGYYIDYGDGDLNTDKNRLFDNHKVWIDNDIPDKIRE